MTIINGSSARCRCPEDLGSLPGDRTEAGSATGAPPEDDLNPVAFWFLRHGETDFNARRVAQGNVEVPLNALGEAQALKAADALVGAGIRTIVSSPLQRAARTAAVVADRLGLAFEIDPELHEASLGVGEGQPMGPWFDRWAEGLETPPGAEPFGALRRRAVGAVNRCLALTGPVLIVSHGGVFRALRQAMGLTANVRLPNGQPVLALPPADRTGSWTLSFVAEAGAPRPAPRGSA